MKIEKMRDTQIDRPLEKSEVSLYGGRFSLGIGDNSLCFSHFGGLRIQGTSIIYETVYKWKQDDED